MHLQDETMLLLLSSDGMHDGNREACQELSAMLSMGLTEVAAAVEQTLRATLCTLVRLEWH